MSHDFSISMEGAPQNPRTIKTEYHYKDHTEVIDKVVYFINEGYIAYFFGYCNGVMYDAFNGWDHFNFWSGDGKSIKITREEAMKGLDFAIAYFDNASNYPDSKRMDDIKQFRKNMDTIMKDAQYFIIQYS